jgi:hypothetical protein
MNQYCVYSLDPRFYEVWTWIKANSLEYDIHLNRTRFWVPTNTSAMTEFLLKWAKNCPRVYEHKEYAVGPVQ